MKRKALILAALLAFIVVNVTAQSDGKRSFRFYAGPVGEFNFITGSYDGESLFNTGVEIINVPKLNPGLGFGVAGGIRMATMSFDFSYSRSYHQFSFLSVEGAQPAALNLIKFMGFRKYLSPEAGIQPFYGFDFSGMFVVFDEMAYRIAAPDSLLSVTYGGFLTGVSGGLCFIFTDNLMAIAEVVPTLHIGTDVKPANSTNYEITKFLNFQINASISVAYLF